MSEPDRRKRDDFAREALPHMDQVYTAGLYLTRNQDEAQDLLQETFLRAYRFWHQFRPGTNCRAWLMTILHNTFKNRYRERYREQQRVDFDDTISDTNSSLNTAAGLADPEGIVLAQFLDTEVEAALKSLPLEFLEVIVLVDIQELTYEEAAATIGCPIGTIRSRLSRGRRLLQAALGRCTTRKQPPQRGLGQLSGGTDTSHHAGGADRQAKGVGAVLRAKRHPAAGANSSRSAGAGIQIGWWLSRPSGRRNERDDAVLGRARLGAVPSLPGRGSATAARRRSGQQG